MTDWDGVEYTEVSTLQQLLARRALSDLELRGVDSLLDVGCGDGRITAAIAEQIPHATVLGLDPSPGMLAVAPRGGRLTFELGDVCSMSFQGEFDAVVSFNALHWVSDQRLALERIAAALRPTGWAFLVFVCAGSRPSVEDVAMQVAGLPRWSPHFVDFPAPFTHPDVDQWRGLAPSCGLTVESHDVADLTWDFGSREAFTRWCAVGFGAWTDRLPGSDRADFVAEIAARYESMIGEPGRLRFMQLRVRLSKTGADSA